MDYTLKQFLSPFQTFDQYMKAFMILDSYEHTTNNEKLRLMTIKLTTFNLTTQEFKNFVDRVRLYQLSSGLDFVKNFEKFQNELHLNAHSSDMSTVSLYSPATSCVFCEHKESDWYTLCSPEFNNMPMLYSNNRIGIYELTHKFFLN